MRTTISLDDELLREAKRRAAERGVTLSALVEGQLREGFARDAPRARGRIVLPVFRGRGGLVPGVELTSNASVAEAMEDSTPR